jgi:hypothetical protein
MSGFSSDWLAAREPWDHRARSSDILAGLTAWLERRLSDPEASARIVDLGCGTGSTLRYLTPHLSNAPAWSLVDGDPGLLEIAASATTATTITADLSTADVDALIAGSDLVTTSALLDLVSQNWLDRLWGVLERRGAGLLAGLTYDGRLAMTPALPFDAVVRDLNNRHQKSDKGFGPALGPDATAALVARARRAGWRVMVRRSDWKLSMEADRTGLEIVINGWAEAAKEVAPGHSARLDDWRHQRLSDQSLEVTVGHRDLLALPPA